MHACARAFPTEQPPSAWLSQVVPCAGRSEMAEEGTLILQKKNWKLTALLTFANTSFWHGEVSWLEDHGISPRSCSNSAERELSK